jgi:hypothetical protein
MVPANNDVEPMVPAASAAKASFVSELVFSFMGSGCACCLSSGFGWCAHCQGNDDIHISHRSFSSAGAKFFAERFCDGE